jgi:hypothetical protein
MSILQMSIREGRPEYGSTIGQMAQRQRTRTGAAR